MKLYEDERQDVADALAAFLGETMHFMHRGAFSLPDGGVCIFGNDLAPNDQRAVEERKSVEAEARGQSGDDVYAAECNGTWVVITYDNDFDADEWRQVVWNTWFAICDAHQAVAAQQTTEPVYGEMVDSQADGMSAERGWAYEGWKDVEKKLWAYVEEFPIELVLGLDDAIAWGKDCFNAIDVTSAEWETDYDEYDTATLIEVLTVLQEYEDALQSLEPSDKWRAGQSLLECVEMLEQDEKSRGSQ
jgi:hypothetical protein